MDRPPSTTSTRAGSIVLPVLKRASCEAYCHAARQAQANEFWWYFNGLAPYRRCSRPFADQSGRWWYRVKPAFAWPVDFFVPVIEPPRGRAFRSLLGWQYPTPEPQADSYVAMNVIAELRGYSLDRVAENKRRAIRKGQRELEIVALSPDDSSTAQAAHEIWVSHTQRTGWNSPMTPQRFAASWAELAQWPGTTVLAARAASGLMCAWLIARWIDDVMYIDTLASHTDRLESRPNDFIVYSCVLAAAQQGAARAHYSLKSSITSLEAFKQSLGFETVAFPARLHLRFPVRMGLRFLRPRLYARLRGMQPYETTMTIDASCGGE